MDATSERTADTRRPRLVDRAAAARLSVLDDIFYRGNHGRGAEVVMQGVWRFAEPIAPDDLADLHRLLAASDLTRRVATSPVPFARRSFVADAIVAPLRVDPEPVAPHDVVAWADDRAAAGFDVDRGPVWEIAVRPVTDGGSAVTVSCSHVVTEGLGLIGVARAALAGSDPSAVRTPTTPPRLRDDVIDALLLWVHVVVGVVRSLARTVTDPQVRTELLAAARPPSRPAAAPSGPPVREVHAVLDVDAAHWDQFVADSGATSTAVATALAADLVREVRGPGPVEVAIPMSGGDETGELMMAETVIDDADDAAVCAGKLRAAYAAAGGGASGSGLGPPGGMPAELLQLLGDRIAHAMVPDPGGREALVSPLGDLGGVFDELGGHRATGMAVRSVEPRPTDTPSRTIVRLWSGRSAGRITLTLVTPARPGRGAAMDRHRLGELGAAVAARRGLVAIPW
ncbi:hypothetical protein OG579_19500 [Williamsia herbipolensis]|uniref:Condensation domain-containing protein n=1 Tax=Williamsia herbipolensis TaxID=1603258 RepID=A0AAU4K1E2_9NOCA|nr:hypothetical protein [Williamsia herbipolensis]